MLAFSWPLRWAHALALVTQGDTGTRGPMLVSAGLTIAHRVLSARALDTEWPQLTAQCPDSVCPVWAGPPARAPQQQQGWPGGPGGPGGHTGFTLNTDISPGQPAPARGRRAEKYTGYTSQDSTICKHAQTPF